MKRIVTGFCLILVLSVSGFCVAAGNDDAVMAKERTMWDSIKKGDYQTFAANVSEDAVEISPDGKIIGKAEIIDNAKKMKTESFSMSDMNVHWINNDIALVTYKANVKGMYENQPVSGNFSVSTIWKKHGENWMAHFHQETPVVPMSPDKK